MEDEESLETSALVGKLADPVEHKINDFSSNGVMTTSVVVGSIFLTGDELLWVEQLTVCASPHLICGKHNKGGGADDTQVIFGAKTPITRPQLWAPGRQTLHGVRVSQLQFR